MTTPDDPYQFSMDDSISSTPRTRSSTRNRKAPVTTTENKTKTKGSNKQKENNPSKTAQQRVATRSSQKSPLVPNDDSFMSNISSGFSQFVNPKKRQREDKKAKATKRPKMTTFVDENEPPDDDAQDIEQVKLIYETAGGRTNLSRAAAKNAQILANRNATIARQPTTNTTYTVNDHNHIIDDTQLDTVAIPDTLVNHNTQHNDSGWQRDIDRLMKKLEEPAKTQTQIEETQPEEEEEEVIGPLFLSQTGKNQQQTATTTTTTPVTQLEKSQNRQTITPILQSEKIQTTTINQTDDIGIQTENSQNPSHIHNCCQDVSVCPCVLRYSKLERLFMEKMSRFISIVPALPNSDVVPEVQHKRRTIQTHSRFRRFRGRRRINNRIVIPSVSNNESTTVEEISDETTTAEIEDRIEENIEPPQEQNETIPANVSMNDPTDNIISTTITIGKNPNPLDDLSAIEKVDTTAIIDHASTLLISSSNNTCSTGRRFVLTTSSLDESQKAQFRSFTTRFNISISSAIDSSTTHVIVNEQSPLVCPLTGKIIQAIARHLFIVSHRWLNECLEQDSIVDERPYEIRGDTSLGTDHGGMRRSRLTPSYLLEKFSICLRCSSNDCAPLQTTDQVQELIELCGGKLVTTFSEIRTIDKERQMILILGINGLAGGEKKRKAILDTCQQFNVKCLNIHWLLISIAKYDIQPFENYDINQV